VVAGTKSSTPLFRLDGRIELPAYKLTVAPRATIKTGVIQAPSVVNIGTVQCDLNVQDKIEFCKDASLAGNKNIEGIEIEGAYFKGDVDIAARSCLDRPFANHRTEPD
jgi:cytoskeletal protein CcmA (bactofilin family)